MVPDKCGKCDCTKFRQSGDDFICKGCGYVNKGAKAAPAPKDDPKK